MKMEGCALTVAGGDIFGCLLGELPQAAANFPLNVLETRKGVEVRRVHVLVEAISNQRDRIHREELAAERQLAADKAREAVKAEKSRKRASMDRKARRKASHAGIYVPKACTTAPASLAAAKTQEVRMKELETTITTLETTVRNLTQRNAELERGMAGVRHECEALKLINEQLSQQRTSAPVSGTHEAAGLLARLLSEPQFEPTPVEVLTCVAALYGDRVTVLPSAWESAEKVGHFVQGRRLLSLLTRLATRYADAMEEGGDIVARQVFTSAEYSSRESDSIMNSRESARARTWNYCGRSLTMQRHLKIGVATDTKLSMRVYFDYLPEEGRIVVGWCGEHRPVPGIKS